MSPGSAATHDFEVNRRPDFNALKRDLSAYMFFANEQREIVRREAPGIFFGDYSDAISKISC